MPIYKRVGKKKTTWQLFYYNPEGKLVGKTFDKKRDAEAYEGKVKAAKREGRYHDVFDVKKETRITFNELTDKYVENFKTQRSYPTKVFTIRDLREEFGDRLLSQITYLDLETYRNRRKAIPLKSGKVRADASVNYQMAVFAHMLAKAVEWGLLENNPFKKGKRLMFKVDNQRKRFLNEAEIESLLRECPRHLKPIVETALLTGMRRGEVLGLKWEQVKDDFIYLTETKSGKSRQIPINDRLAEVLKEVRRDNQLKSEYVFCDAQGRRFQDVKSSLNGACRRAGIRDFTFHDLRHTFASHLVMNGVGLKAVQELLGHADLGMTMRYAHLSQGHLREAVAKGPKLPDIKEVLIKATEDKKEVSQKWLTT
jgi:integrase